MNVDHLLEQQLGCVQRASPGKERGILHGPMDEHDRTLSDDAMKLMVGLGLKGADVCDAFLDLIESGTGS